MTRFGDLLRESGANGGEKKREGGLNVVKKGFLREEKIVNSPVKVSPGPGFHSLFLFRVIIAARVRKR